ncbi:MAG: tRNA (adenosine(37)-N6)-dimethylallyltransferase MiaA [Thermodesulfovibrionales bacterium]|jgi:tRNA dimethylallyltransferase
MEKVIILLGPTGVGKTALSLLLARELETEIISSDSMQIYRGMDIGTAKPSPAEQERVRHHMIDIVDPWETYSAGAYISDVVPVLERILSEGRTPLIVGGTGLYIKAMTRGIFHGPSADWELRDSLMKKEEEEPGILYGMLQEKDPAAASRIMPADLRRVVRALEVCLTGEKTITDFHQSHTEPLPYEFIKIGISRERQELYRMIDARVDEMLRQDLVEEVRNLLGLIRNEGGDPPVATLPAFQAIGYKELLSHLSDKTPLEEAADLIRQRSRNYAKRQFTWFRKEEGIHWVDATGIYDPSEIFRKVMPLLQNQDQR